VVGPNAGLVFQPRPPGHVSLPQLMEKIQTGVNATQ
jgi:hypothetical protein